MDPVWSMPEGDPSRAHRCGSHRSWKGIFRDASHPEILIARRDVALCLFQLGWFEEALELFERLLVEWTDRDDNNVDHEATGGNRIAIDCSTEIALLPLDMAEVHFEWGGEKHAADASELLEALLRLMDDGDGQPLDVGHDDDDDRQPWRRHASKSVLIRFC